MSCYFALRAITVSKLFLTNVSSLPSKCLLSELLRTITAAVFLQQQTVVTDCSMLCGSTSHSLSSSWMDPSILRNTSAVQQGGYVVAYKFNLKLLLTSGFIKCYYLVIFLNANCLIKTILVVMFVFFFNGSESAQISLREERSFSRLRLLECSQTQTQNNTKFLLKSNRTKENHKYKKKKITEYCLYSCFLHTKLGQTNWCLIAAR